MTANEKRISVGLTSDQLGIALAEALAQESVHVYLTRRQVGWAIFDVVGEMLRGLPDDAGLDWFTDDDGRTYINGELEWKVSDDPNVATLVDAVNILNYGKPMKIDQDLVDDGNES